MSETQTRVFKTRIRGTIEAVWREITKTDEVQGVMFNMRLDAELRAGAPVRYRSPDGKYTGIIGEVVAIEPLTRYAHTFKFTQYDEPACVVVHELDDLGDGTVEYRMTCSDMVVGTKTTKQMTRGGDMIVRNLKAVVETGRLPLGTRLLYRVFALMAPFTPKRLRSENWP